MGTIFSIPFQEMETERVFYIRFHSFRTVTPDGDSTRGAPPPSPLLPLQSPTSRHPLLYRVISAQLLTLHPQPPAAFLPKETDHLPLSSWRLCYSPCCTSITVLMAVGSVHDYDFLVAPCRPLWEQSHCPCQVAMWIEWITRPSFQPSKQELSGRGLHMFTTDYASRGIKWRANKENASNLESVCYDSESLTCHITILLNITKPIKKTASTDKLTPKSWGPSLEASHTCLEDCNGVETLNCKYFAKSICLYKHGISWEIPEITPRRFPNTGWECMTLNGQEKLQSMTSPTLVPTALLTWVCSWSLLMVNQDYLKHFLCTMNEEEKALDVCDHTLRPQPKHHRKTERPTQPDVKTDVWHLSMCVCVCVVCIHI